MARISPLIGAALLTCAMSMAPAHAQERDTLGVARLFTNDALGDGQDRWRSGGFGVMAFRGADWNGDLPTRPGAIMEYRLRGEVIAPDNLANPAAGDRLYAGSWWIGAHTHFGWSGFEVTGGADIVITGEQSGVRRFQESVHDLFSMPSMNVENFQVQDGVYLHGTLEVARDIGLGGGAIRPFVEVQAGVETMARVGFDLTLGNLGEGGLRARDPITGQRIAGIRGDGGGWSGLFGADIAHVDRSVFLPTDQGYQVEEDRMRLRAGVNYGFGSSNLFYGVTYLSEEFVGQSEGQVVGSLSLNIQF